MKFNKTRLLIITLIFLLLGLAALVLLNKQNPLTPSQNQTVERFNPSTSPQAASLEVLSHPFPNQLMSLTDPIRIDFNAPLDLTTLTIKLVPATPYQIFPSNDRLSIIIKPVAVWSYNQKYLMVIGAGLKSDNGETLNQDFSYNFETDTYQGI